MKILICAFMTMLVGAVPALAAEYTVQAITGSSVERPYRFEPSNLEIQPGDTVIFENAQDDFHDVMFDGVPEGVEGMLMSPMMEKKGEKWSYMFTVPGSYHFHCHPHEELSMQGMIVVGTASAPEKTRKMEHKHMHGS